EMARSRRPLFPFVLKMTILQILVPGGLTAVAALLFPALFAFIFGEPWRAAGEFAQWMSLWVVCMLGNIPVVRVLPVIGRQRLHLLFKTLLMIGGGAGMLIGYEIRGTIIGSVAFYSAAAAMIYVMQIITYLVAVRNYDASVPTDD